MSIAIKVGGNNLRCTLIPRVAGQGIGADGIVQLNEAPANGDKVTVLYEGQYYTGDASNVVYEPFRYWQFGLSSLPGFLNNRDLHIWRGDATIEHKFALPETAPNDWEEITPSESDVWSELTGRVSQEIGPGDYINVGSEVMRVQARAGNRLRVQRGVEGTEAKAHERDDAVQFCYTVENENAATVILELLEVFSDLNGVRFNTDDLLFLRNVFLPTYRFPKTIITKPTGADELLKEIQQSCAFSVWYDSGRREMRARAITGGGITQGRAELVNDNTVITNTVKIKDEPRKATSRTYIYSGLVNPTDLGKESKNWRYLDFAADGEKESRFSRGEARAKIIYSRWLNPSQAAASISRYIKDGRVSSGEITFDMPLGFAVTQIQIGDIYEYVGLASQSETGNLLPFAFRIVSIRAKNETTAEVKGVRSGYIVSGVSPFVLGQSRLGGNDTLV